MTNETKQTAVDIMFYRAISVLPMGAIDAKATLKETYLQAKEMEKEQHKNTWYDSRLHNYIGKQKSFEDFYNETYGK